MTDRPDGDIAGARRAHARLLETVSRIDDETASQPSLLPGWDVAMLVTHLARNADSHRQMLEGAVVGEVRHQYPSHESRDAGIEAGRGRAAEAATTDLRTAVARLEDAWATFPGDRWSCTALTTDGRPNPVADLPFQRWRETEVHHADLGLGFTTGEWDPEYVDAELDASVAALPDRLPPGAGVALRATDTGRTWTAPEGARVTTRVDAPAHALLSWLLGRQTDGFPEIGPWQFVVRR